MGQPQADQSMDEILASIRRIISEDETPAPSPEADTPTAERLDTLDLRQSVEDTEAEEVLASVEPEFAQEEPTADSVDAFFEEKPGFEASTDAVVEEALITQEVIVEAPEAAIVEEPAPAEPTLERVSLGRTVAAAAAPAVASEVEAFLEEDSMLTKSTTKAASSAFDALAENIRIAEGEGRTLESLVERMVEPMLKSWLDENLSRIVEEKVEDEVRRIARRR